MGYEAFIEKRFSKRSEWIIEHANEIIESYLDQDKGYNR